MQRPVSVRYARKGELQTMAQLSVTAFRHSGRRVNAALFPEHLRTKPGDTDEVEFTFKNLWRTFESRNRHYVVAVDEQDAIMGWAEWTSGEDPVVAMTPEEKKTTEVARLPESLDLDAAKRLGREAEELSAKLIEALGEEGYRNSWSRSNVTLVMQGDLSLNRS